MLLDFRSVQVKKDRALSALERLIGDVGGDHCLAGAFSANEHGVVCTADEGECHQLTDGLEQYAKQVIVSTKTRWRPELIGGATHTFDDCASDISAVIQYSVDSRGANTRSLGDVL